MPLSLRYFSPLGFFGGVGATYVHQHVVEPSEAVLPEGSDSFVLLDATIGYGLPERRGLISLGARNILDTNMKFQDDSFREYGRGEAGVVSPYLPKRTILGMLTLNF